MKKKAILIFVSFVLVLGLTNCKEKSDNKKFKVVTTTTMITDLVKNIGQDSILIEGLMGAGVDPHLYKASESDVKKLTSANAIFYNGLHLEGKMVDIFEKMQHSGKKTYSINSGLGEDKIISSENFAGNYDPHIWFSIQNWISATKYVAEKLSELQPQNKDFFYKNAEIYKNELVKLETELKETAAKLPKEERVLVTAHDAFSYFGKEFDFEVVGLQGISTTSEAGTKDILDLANFIVERKVPAIFVESSVPKQTILALQKSVESKGHDVKLGGTLYSDALGDPNTAEGTYIGMFRSNMNTIVNALLDHE